VFVAKLIYSDQGEELEFILDGSRSSYTIGRNPMCDLRINNPSISRKHAELRLDAGTGRYAIYDLNSSNGTYVNGKRESSAVLTPGDELLCGEFKIRFLDADASGAGGRSSAHAPAIPDTFDASPVDLSPSPPPVATGAIALEESVPGASPDTALDRPVAPDVSGEVLALRDQLETLQASLRNESARADAAEGESDRLRAAIDTLTETNAELQTALVELGDELRALLAANESLLARVGGVDE
jgi:predicted component of type VI protein secretion system